MQNELIIRVAVNTAQGKLSVITTDMLYTTAVLQAPRLIRVMMQGGDENRQVRWRGRRGWMEARGARGAREARGAARSEDRHVTRGVGWRRQEGLDKQRRGEESEGKGKQRDKWLDGGK